MVVRNTPGTLRVTGERERGESGAVAFLFAGVMVMIVVWHSWVQEGQLCRISGVGVEEVRHGVLGCFGRDRCHVVR